MNTKKTAVKALVTGASRGIGRSIALRLAASGIAVGLHYHYDVAEAERVAAEIRSLGVEAFMFKADLSDPLQIKTLAEESWEKMNGFDFLVNNAGISYKKDFLDITSEDIQSFLGLNFTSALFLSQAIAKKNDQRSYRWQYLQHYVG